MPPPPRMNLSLAPLIRSRYPARAYIMAHKYYYDALPTGQRLTARTVSLCCIYSLRAPCMSTIMLGITGPIPWQVGAHGALSLNRAGIGVEPIMQELPGVPYATRSSNRIGLSKSVPDLKSYPYRCRNQPNQHYQSYHPAALPSGCAIGPLRTLSAIISPRGILGYPLTVIMPLRG